MPTCRACGEREATIIEVVGRLVDPDTGTAPVAPAVPPAAPAPTLCHPCMVVRFPPFLQPYITGERPIPQEWLDRMERMRREDDAIDEEG